MIRNNNVNYLKYIGGRPSSFMEKSTANKNIINNTLIFNNSVSYPQGYNSEQSIIMPLKTGQKIGVRVIADSSLTSILYTLEKQITTMLASSDLIANMSTAEAMDAILTGSSSSAATGRVLEVLRAAIDTGARPSAFDIAQEILQAKTANYRVTGTIGKAIGDSGGSSDPWGVTISNYPDSTAGKILEKMLQILNFLQIK